MTDRENFLERWSRKKAGAEQEGDLAAKTPTEARRTGEDPARRPTSVADTKPPSPAIPKAEFDIASLPSLESITKATDVRAFLTPGVPAELTRAALRRAWAADPAIRDFVGLQDYDWDFVNPGGTHGFGDIAPDFDVKKLVAQIFGERDESSDPVAATAKPPSPADMQPAQITNRSELPGASNAVPRNDKGGDDGQQLPAGDATSFTTASIESNLVHRNNNTATHKSIPETQPDELKISRKHGSALPK